MKRSLVICILFISTYLLQLQAQAFEKSCYYGITFELSKNPNWGYGELVITDVEPNSPAEQSGIKIGDIIMEINGKATYLRDNQTIAKWLFDVYDPVVKFTVRNMNTYFKEYELIRKCVNTNSVSEQQLSAIFSFYSLENTNSQIFALPTIITPTKGVDYADYHTFDFIKEEGRNVPPIDAYITSLISKELQAKGLVRDTQNPDIIIQSYYSYSPNPKFTGLHENPNYKQHTSRFDKDIQKMVSLPIFDIGTSKMETVSQYIVEFGISFYDKKYINPPQLTQIWDCNLKDFLSTKYPLEEYVRIHTPLVLMQFPYTAAKTESKYKVTFNKYNYTGLYFDANDLTTIQDVDINSLAYQAGIRSRYIVRKIGNKKFNHTKESLSEGYKKFILGTMIYRDQNTQFTNAEGYADCMFWDAPYYPNVLKEFNKPEYETSFSYLYDFEKYVNSKSSKNIPIEIWDGVQIRAFNITPEIRQSTVIKTID